MAPSPLQHTLLQASGTLAAGDVEVGRAARPVDALTPHSASHRETFLKVKRREENDTGEPDWSRRGGTEGRIQRGAGKSEDAALEPSLSAGERRVLAL